MDSSWRYKSSLVTYHHNNVVSASILIQFYSIKMKYEKNNNQTFLCIIIISFLILISLYAILIYQ